MKQPIQPGQNARPLPRTPAATVLASETNIGNDLTFLSGVRSDAEFEKAARHSDRVRLLRILLPVAGLVVLLGVLGTLVLQKMLLPDLEIANIEVNDGKLIMENPNLNGMDENQRPYRLKADRAIQDASNPTVVELQTISATLPMDETISAQIEAGNGVYDSDAKTLVLTREVLVKTSDGMEIFLHDADVDIDKGTLETRSPIRASSAQADISSASLYVEGGGDRLVFEGKVRMTLRPSESKNSEEANQ